MRLIGFLLRRARPQFLLSVLLSTIGGIVTTGLLITINAVINHARWDVRRLLWAFVALAVMTMAVRMGASLLLAYLGQNALLHLRMSLTRQILSIPLRKLEEIGASSILTILTDDIPNIANFTSILPILCTNSVIAVTCLIYMGWLSSKLLAVVAAFLIVGVLTYEYLNSMAERHLVSARSEHKSLLGQFRTLIEGTKELKLHRARRESFLSRVMQGTAVQFRSHMLRGMRIYAAALSWGELLMFLAIGLVIFVPPSFIHISESTIVAFVMAMLYLVGPLETIMNSLPQVSRANIALKSVIQMGLTLSEFESRAEDNDRQLAATLQCIGMCGVTFAYQTEGGEKFTVGPLNLRFFPGEIVFFTGGNGSGKTTMAKILAGLYKPESGYLTLNQQPVSDDLRDAYRQNFSAVFSDFHLFESLLGLDRPMLDETANQYLEQLQLRGKVQISNGAFSSVDLSQGQRKRLALLTAYMEDRPVYLFDEWAADQDPFFKQIFYHQILSDLRARGKIVLIITHDDAYFHLADRIIKLDFGKVVSDQVVATPAAVS